MQQCEGRHPSWHLYSSLALQQITKTPKVSALAPITITYYYVRMDESPSGIALGNIDCQNIGRSVDEWRFAVPYSMEIIEDRIVEVFFTGAMDFDEARASRVETAALMKSHCLERTLVDMSETVSPSPGTYDVFDFNASHYEVFPPGSRVAVVIPPRSDMKQQAAFGETVAQNRGTLMRIFVEREPALAWLRTGTTTKK